MLRNKGLFYITKKTCKEMDEKFTQQMQAWLDTPKEKRDLAAGAMMVLKCNNNKILYQNVMRAPKRHAEVIEYNMKKWLKFRLQQKTHAEVEAMAASVKAIVAKHELNKIENTDNKNKPDTDGIYVVEGEGVPRFRPLVPQLPP